jgi:hypothetical protein
VQILDGFVMANSRMVVIANLEWYADTKPVSSGIAHCGYFVGRRVGCFISFPAVFIVMASAFFGNLIDLAILNIV